MRVVATVPDPDRTRVRSAALARAALSMRARVLRRLFGPVVVTESLAGLALRGGSFGKLPLPILFLASLARLLLASAALLGCLGALVVRRAFLQSDSPSCRAGPSCP